MSSVPGRSLPIDRFWSGKSLSEWIVAVRPVKNRVDIRQPYAYLVEPERSISGKVEDVATIFLTNRECPFRCLMCDLWKNTTGARVPPGTIPAQIAFALDRLPPTRNIKLYNAGNFFDAQAIPPCDWSAIAERLAPFETVIIECHPLLIGDDCLAFRDMLNAVRTGKRLGPARLQVAMGLETVHPDVLPQLNKCMSLADFEKACRFLQAHAIDVRAFILLRPPFLDEAEAVCWAKRSIEFAFAVGVECCVVIPARSGNGAMDQLQERGLFCPPRIESLETVVEFGVRLRHGRVFADLWDVEKLYRCLHCGPSRMQRLRQINLIGRIPPPVSCACQRP